MSIHGVQKSGYGTRSVDILSSIQLYGACETAACAVCLSVIYISNLRRRGTQALELHMPPVSWDTKWRLIFLPGIKDKGNYVNRYLSREATVTSGNIHL
jgi:hypothetical protein